MNKRLTLIGLSTALLLAACGGTVPTGSAPSTGTTGAAPAASDVAALRASLAQTPRLSDLRGQQLPDLANLSRTGSEGDTSQELVIGYGDRAFVDRLAAHLGARVADTIPELGLALLRLPDSLSVARTAAALSVSPVRGLRFAEANRYDAALPVVPDAAALGTQDLRAQADSDPLSIKQWWIRQIQADQVRGVSTGKGVIVGVIDDDFNRQHEDLKAEGKIVTGLDTRSGKLLTPDLPLTTGDHGSGSAGTIGERLGNGVGGAGVAPDAVLMPIRIFDERGYTGSFNVAKGFVFAVNGGARVLNNSWGGGGYTQVVKEAVDYALSKRVVVVGSAGNDHRGQMSGPGAYTGAINVGASAGDDMKADFSNLGARVDLFAPGDNGLTTYSTTNTGYGLFGGTSMAAPVVSGAAALLLQLKPDLTPYQIKKLLAASGDPMKDPRTQGFNRVNVKRALDELKAGRIPADGGAVQVEVVDISEASSVSGTDVLLTPLNGQNKGMAYIGRTGTSQLEADAKTSFSGVARFFGVEPGRYRVSVAGPSVNVYGGTRDNVVGEITVAAGGGQNLRYAHQVDFYEYGAGDQRNNSLQAATDLTGIPTAAFAGGLLFGGAFDSANFVYAPPVSGADVDYLKLNVGAGQTLTVQGYAALLGSKTNVKVDLLNASGAVVAEGKAAPGASGGDSVASVKATTAGTYYIRFSNTTAQEGLGAFYTSIVTIK